MANYLNAAAAIEAAALFMGQRNYRTANMVLDLALELIGEDR